MALLDIPLETFDTIISFVDFRAYLNLLKVAKNSKRLAVSLLRCRAKH
jgi:hypothetical protein